ncbi:AAA family ATPase [Novosphingobium sp. Gsoil 351]|uniref:AAA family ATPase n=1 Tax=Novosphingobium sp. Gsoil 351 TaxID=2675225 RepID=UPI0018A805F8|nr:AAA family ATPase [Novosphingobium sp. Gsoil 351]
MERFVAAEAALAEPDEDFHVLGIGINFEDGSGEIESWHDPQGWDLHDDDETNALLIKQVELEALAALRPWVSHYASLGLMCAGNLAESLLDGQRDDFGGGPEFYVVHRKDDAPEDLVALGDFPEFTVKLAAMPGKELTVRPFVRPINATILFNAARQGIAPGLWCDEVNSELAPLPAEERDDWLARRCLPGSTLARIMKRWTRSGGDIELFGMVGSAEERTTGNQPIEWLVPGLVPKGALGLLVAEHETGKSTLLTELAAVIDSESDAPRMFLGTAVSARGVVVTVSGEDAESIISDRESYFEEEHGPACGFVIDARGKTLDYVFKIIERIPEIALLIVEPVTVFLEGRETDNSDLSSFYNRFNDFIVRKGCGVLLAHHVVKSKRKLTSLGDFDWATRGGGASIDRARIVIGMLDRGLETTMVGIVKQNFPPSQALWAPVKQGKLFKRNSATLRLEPIASESPAPVSRSMEADAARVLGVLRTRVAHGQIVRRTGKSELWEAKLPELADLSRGAIRNAVAALIASGRICDGPDGLQIIAPPEDEQGAN